MKTKLYFPVIAIFVIAISSCKKFDGGSLIKPSTLTHGGGPDTDVYAAGYVTGVSHIFPRIATYWKNGKLIKLSDSTEDAIGTGIALQDTDVLVPVTITHNNGKNAALYWRNHIEIALDENATTGQIAVSKCGCEFYIAGTIRINNHDRAVYWKDGLRHVLPGGSATTRGFGITVANGDVYVTGVGVTANDVVYAMYWKNDTPFILADTLNQSSAGGITVSRNDVYIAGAIGHTSSTGLSTISAVYWKNGVAISLPDPGIPNGSGAGVIAINKGDIYVGGAGGNSEGVYWKNGIETHLSNSTYQADPPTSVVILGSNVYFSGIASPFAGEVQPVIPAYWKNNSLTLLPYTGAGGSAMGLTVVLHH